MGGQNSQRIDHTFDGWMRDVEKRSLNQDRRPEIRSASDLLGPGFSPYSVEIRDWNDDATAFNGMYHSTPGALNGPDDTSFWMGRTQGTTDGFGLQRVCQYAGIDGDARGEEWERRFFAPGAADIAYSSWALVSDTRYIGESIMTFTETPPNSRYLFANGMSLVRADYPELFTVYNTLHGAVDATHFNLPDMRGRFPQGSHENIGFLPGNADDLAPDNRITRHSHAVATNNDHTHTAGTLQAGLSADRAAGGLGRATQDISGSTGPSGGHNHGGVTGDFTHDRFPHIRVAFHIRARP